MLRLIPARLHRQLYRLAHFARRYWLRFAVSQVDGCAIIGRDDDGRFLLVRHSYGPAVWAFPGGGVKPDEDPIASAGREFMEELGCTLAGARLVGIQDDVFLGTRNVVRVVTGLVEGEPRPDRREVVEARFFERGEFPANLSSTVPTRLAALDDRSQQG